MNLQSWNRFNSYALQVVPNVMGQLHRFTFEGAKVEIALPSTERAKDETPGRDSVAEVGTRWASTNEPINYRIFKVDVVACLERSLELPSEVLDVNPNAFESVAEDTQEKLKSSLADHAAIARRAFQYWLTLIQWVTGDHRIGRGMYSTGLPEWSTRLQEMSSGKTIWIADTVFKVPSYSTVTSEQWSEVNAKLQVQAATPVHLVLKFEAEHFLDLGDFRRSLMDTAIACETYLRTTVLATLPTELTPSVRKQIEDASISQYANHFFLEILDDAAKEKYKKLKEELKSLNSKRNDLFHRGDSSAATAENCRRFLDRLNDLFAINP